MVATTLWNMVGSRKRMDDNHHEFAHDDNDNDNIRVLLQEPLLQEEEEQEEGVNKININKSNEDDVHKRGATIHSYYLWLGIMVGIMAQLVWYDVIMVALLTVLTQSFSVRIAMAVTLVLILTKFVLSIMICIQLPSDDDDKNNNDDVDDQLEQEFMAYDDDEEQPMKRHADDQPRRTQEQEPQQEPQQQQQAETSFSSSLSSQRAIGCFCMGVLVGICIAIVIVDGLLLLDNQPLYSWHYFQAVVSTSRH